jgi:hypothetical protein
MAGRTLLQSALKTAPRWPHFAVESKPDHSTVRLLDTPKLVHIWYTTITTRGWSDLEFNDSSPRIGNMKSRLFSAQVIFGAVTARICAVTSGGHGELQ